MVIAVTSMLVMKTSIDNIVYMISVSSSLMFTIRTVSMIVRLCFIALIGIHITYF